ncbi:hypothetical protein Y919_11915 [Caloranaerobacter azorensis H53214]|uniref:Uncharacterized protein n=1 Tax=Caloranaerobacter azorensis H53214 TaxID=1156417 RepID=A0A096BE75_9FIRM|nr:hypothetical protein [Caloranaerobacter azorensis]KGG79460.1 hypothetical protein Y919_11915 [Caloranaerobacter azorensis H53214]
MVEPKFILNIIVIIFILIIIYTQIISPIQAKVIFIDITPAVKQSDRFNAIKKYINNRNNDSYESISEVKNLDDIQNYYFVNYGIKIRNLRLISIGNLEGKIYINRNPYPERFLIRTKQSFYRYVEKLGSTVISDNVLINTKNLSNTQIEEIVRNVKVTITWKDLFGIRRHKRIKLSKDLNVDFE